MKIIDIQLLNVEHQNESKSELINNLKTEREKKKERRKTQIP